MVLRLLPVTLSVLAIVSYAAATFKVGTARFPDKIYGVNLGSWLVLEPWMLPETWHKMGGETCPNCADCIASEFAFAKAYPDTVDETFQEHWKTWFNQEDVDKLKAAGINSVRIPLGYWLVEPLVAEDEFFPKGGFAELRRGLKQLNDAGIVAMLDHHALPGAQSQGQQFAGVCTAEPKFYTPHNYHRALVWAAVMTTFTHLLPEFSNVVALQAVNEVLMDGSKTPGYGDYQKNFVQVVRAVEFTMGIPVAGLDIQFPPFDQGLSAAFNFTLATNVFNPEVISVLMDSVPIILEMALKYDVDILSPIPRESRTPLTTAFMDVTWQYKSPSNPADAAIGPQIYDNHLYYAYGGVADANPTAYLKSMCNLERIKQTTALRNTPLVCGEWSLATNFEATDKFLKDWADAQKMMYSKGAGWMFWSFKIEDSPTAMNFTRVWSYFEGLKRGYFTQDPSAYNNPNVCAKYTNSTA